MLICGGARLGALLIAIAAFGQTPTAGPRFEAATIVPATVSDQRAAAGGGRGRIDPARIEMRGASLHQLICTAYRLETYQTVSGPDWINKMFFDVYATLPEGAVKSQIPEMLQALLADQMKLALRREIRQEPVCILSVGKNGPRLKEAPAGAAPDPPPHYPDGRTPVMKRRVPSGIVTYSRLNGTVILDAARITMPELAGLLRSEVNLPVLDRTDLHAFYAISLFVPGGSLLSARQRGDSGDIFQPAPNDIPSVPVASEPQGVNLFKSIQRLGLKLEKSKVPVEHLVVESALPATLDHR